MAKDMDRMVERLDVDLDDVAQCTSDEEGEHLEHDGVIRVTEKAALISFGGNECWVPKSQIIDVDHDSVVVTAWFAEKEGW